MLLAARPYNKTIKYSIRKISKGLDNVICVCASDGENVSIIAEIHDHNICEEHGTPESWAEKIVSALNGGNVSANGGSVAVVVKGNVGCISI